MGQRHAIKYNDTPHALKYDHMKVKDKYLRPHIPAAKL